MKITDTARQAVSQLSITSSKAGITVVGSFFDVGIFRGSKTDGDICQDS